MIRARAVGLALVSCMLLAGVAPQAEAAGLPWKDANPLERLFGKPKHPPAHRSRPRHPARARPAPAKASPIVAGVPVPNARPKKSEADTDLSSTNAGANPKANALETEAASEKGKAADAEAPAVPSEDSVPKPTAAKPDLTDDPKLAHGGEPEARADSAEEESRKKSASKPVPSASQPDPQVDADKAETKPVEEIPVPARRPADANADTPKPEPEKPTEKLPAKADQAPAKVDKAETKEDEAPNSTEKLKARTADVTPAASVQAAAAVEDAKLCEAELTKRGVDFTVGESISEGDCGVLRPVNVKRLSSGVKVSPDTQFLCRTALALDVWMTEGVMPAVKADLPDRKLSEFRHASTYVCRPRASESGISEHARGSAIDIATFVFDKGEDIGVAAKEEGSPEAKFQAEIRAAACGPFKTVLGPGTDPDHATHFHLDIAARKNGSTYCK